jgi:hypothetical protein
MPSARKQRRQARNKGTLSFHFAFVNKKIAISLIVSFCIAIFVLSLFAIGNKKFWDGKNKLAIAVREPNGASVLLFDPQYEEVTRIHIPQHTEVDVSYGLGIWKIETLWQLGIQQGVGGKILADTMTKYFHFPTSAWADANAIGFASGNLTDLYRAAFGVYSSNLSMGDKIALSLFSFNIPNAKHVDIDLSDTGYLTEKTLSDGTTGYVKVEPPPAKILALFADPIFSKTAHAVSIEDATGTGKVAKNVGQVIEVLGAKVASITDHEEKDVDCIVSGKSEVLVSQVAAIFNCKKEDRETRFDVQILLGSQFAKRF